MVSVDFSDTVRPNMMYAYHRRHNLFQASGRPRADPSVVCVYHTAQDGFLWSISWHLSSIHQSLTVAVLLTDTRTATTTGSCIDNILGCVEYSRKKHVEPHWGENAFLPETLTYIEPV